MSKKVSTKSKNFIYKASNDLPKLRKGVTKEWDLKRHYYTSSSTSKIEQDAKRYETAVNAFVKKYKRENFTISASKLTAALRDYENLCNRTEASKIMRYFAFRSTLNVNDTEANRKQSQFAERFRKLSNELLFFKLTIGSIPVSKQRKYLKEKSLSHFQYFLKLSFEESKHQLTEPEERILTLRSNTSSEMWVDGTEKIVSNRTISYKEKRYTLPEALEQIDLLQWSEKSKFWEMILDEMVNISEFVEHELSAVVLHKKVSDELRGYKNPYSATVQSYENNEKAVEALVKAISEDGFKLSREFYSLKAKLHNKKSIPYVNKYDPIGTLPQPNFTTSVNICRDVFYNFNPLFGEIFDRMFTSGQVDVYPKAGKRGGAFMAGTVGLPTYVMLNHKSNFKSLETMAHEMGHAVHAELSKKQTPFYQEFSTTTAETASTLFEQLVMQKIYEALSNSDKIIFLHDKITRDIATVQRQIAFYNFELQMHNHVREHGIITKEELASYMQKHLMSYLGKGVNVSSRDGYSYVYIPHVRYGFYVYTYAYGHLVSNLMIKNYQADSKYMDKILYFLEAGGSDTVENIFSSTSIDTMKVQTFVDSLQSQKNEISQLKKLTSKK